MVDFPLQIATQVWRVCAAMQKVSTMVYRQPVFPATATPVITPECLAQIALRVIPLIIGRPSIPAHIQGFQMKADQV